MIFLPMLAQTFKDGHRLEWPVLVQPKIDGIRCTASMEHGGVILRTRTGMILMSPYLDTIRNIRFNDNIILDGELSSPDSPFEVLSGACRSNTITRPVVIHFNVFDMMDLNRPMMPFRERIGCVASNVIGGSSIQIVPTILVADQDGIKECHERFIKEGYEGIIIRNMNSAYKPGVRSWDLQKLKKFMEDEFIITGFSEGTRSDAGTVIWECATGDGSKFHVRPVGSREHRKQLLNNAPAMVGSRLTVAFQELTRHGIPRFPVGKSIRFD